MTRNWWHASIADDRHPQQRRYCPVGEDCQVLRPSLHDEGAKIVQLQGTHQGHQATSTTDDQYGLVIRPTNLRADTHGEYEALSRPLF